jgi:hypothetical protein
MAFPIIAAIISALGSVAAAKMQSQGQAAQASASRMGGAQQPFTPVSSNRAAAANAASDVAQAILAQRAASQQPVPPVVASTGGQTQSGVPSQQNYNQYLSNVIRQTMEQYLGQRAGY